LSLIFRLRRRPYGQSSIPTSIPSSRSAIPSTVLLVTIGLYVLAFLRLPHQPGYLIPVIPFFILLLAHMLERKVFVWVCSLIMLSPFVEVDRSGVQMGPIFADNAARVAGGKFSEQVIAASDALPQRSRVVAGWHLPVIEASLVERHQPSIDEKFDYLVDAVRLQSIKSED
jgi:hypothetical protein